MIAEKLLAYAKPAPPIDPGNTLFLSNWLVAGVPPVAQIGTLGVTGSAVNSAGVLSLYGNVPGTFGVQAGSLDNWDNWVVDLFVFEQGPLPGISISAAAPGWGYMAAASGNSISLSPEGTYWIYNTVPVRQSGKNHLAFGRQAGKMQAWLNGVRFVDDSSAPVPPPLGGGPGSIYIHASSTSIGPLRIVGADIYGDSAFIAVPTEPLGIV